MPPITKQRVCYAFSVPNAKNDRFYRIFRLLNLSFFGNLHKRGISRTRCAAKAQAVIEFLRQFKTSDFMPFTGYISMNNSILFSKRPIFLFLFVFAVFSIGCFSSNENEEEINSEYRVDPNKPLDGSVLGDFIPLPSELELAHLGKKNDLNLRWLFSDGLYGCFMQPGKIKRSELDRKLGERSLADFLGLNLLSNVFPGIPIDYNSVDKLILASKTETFERPITRGNIQEYELVSNFSFVLNLFYSEPVSPEPYLQKMFPGMNIATEVMIKELPGGGKYYELPRFFQAREEYRFYFPQDGKTVVVFTGTDSAFEDMMSQNTSGAIFERMGRLDLQSTDAAMLLTIEGSYGMQEQMYGIVQQVNMMFPNVLSPELQKLLAQHTRSFTLLLNTGASMDEPAFSIQISTETPENAEEIRKQARGLLLNMEINYDENSLTEQAVAMFGTPDVLKFVVTLVQSIRVKSQDNQVRLDLNNFESLEDVAARNIGAFLDDMEENIYLSETTAYLNRVGNAMFEYHKENGKFPPNALKDSDGKPLLSWRVLVLPYLGEEEKELFKQFNLTEPWDGPTNRPLLDKMPQLFADARMLSGRNMSDPFNKTTFRVFSSPGTPFSNPDLTVSDVKFRDRTIMLLAVSPKHAVEWTKPDTLEFDENTFYSLFEGKMPMVLFNSDCNMLRFANTPQITHQFMHIISGTEHHHEENTPPDTTQ